MPTLTVADPLLPALVILYERLAAAPLTWAVTASLGLRLQGMDLPVHDIDLCFDREGVYQAEALLGEFITQPVAWKPSPTIRSHFGQLEITGCPVDIMGPVEHLSPEGIWLALPPLEETRRWVDYQHMRLPVIAIEHLSAAYELLGRAEKAARIRRFLDQRAA